jgi:glycosyltransferase involved in cell wall biosynthesis
MLRKRSIALISSYEHPSYGSIAAMVRQAFPEFEIQTFSTTAIIKNHLGWSLPNSGFILTEYGRRLLRGTIDLRTAYLQTSYVLRRLRAQMRDELDPDRYAFSFQIQSLYDTSVPGIPNYIYTDHTHLSNLASDYFDRALLRSEAWRDMERATYHNATCVFTRSHNINRDLMERYGVPATQILCVYAGANADVHRASTSRDRADGNRRVLFVGQDWERKGGPVLAQAFAEVLQSVPDAHLTIVGAQPELSLANCEVLGLVPLERVSQCYSESSIFCLPTLLEPFGIAVLEAMAHRLPVVTTRVGAMPEMVLDGATGLLVDPGNAGQLAQALLELLNAPNRCRVFGEAGFQHLRGRYTWEAVGARIRERIMRDLSAGGTLRQADAQGADELRPSTGSGILHERSR